VSIPRSSRLKGAPRCSAAPPNSLDPLGRLEGWSQASSNEGVPEAVRTCLQPMLGGSWEGKKVVGKTFENTGNTLAVQAGP